MLSSIFAVVFSGVFYFTHIDYKVFCGKKYSIIIPIYDCLQDQIPSIKSRNHISPFLK